jgi:leader peptidase (prepilin peptidase)/N-methyltransferase
MPSFPVLPEFFQALALHPVFAALWAGVVGVVLGSFFNVVILRWPKRMEAQWRAEARAVLDLPEDPTPLPPGIEAHSRCPVCAARIRWFDNIPLLSYVLLRGRCRACKTPISAQYPLVEALAGLGCAGLVVALGVTPWAALSCGLWLGLLLLSAIDWRTMLLPDPLVYVLLWVGLLASAFQWTGFPPLVQAVWGAAAGYGALWTFYWAFRLLRGKEGLGYGDFKLYAALGAWCGLGGLIPILVVATGAGLLGAVGVALSGRDARQALPFGPALALGGLVQWLNPHWMDGIVRALAGGGLGLH